MTNERSGPVQVFDPQPGVVYNLDALVHVTGVSRRSILVYCKTGLVQPSSNPETEALTFTEEAVYTVRRIEHLRNSMGINLAGVRMILELMREVRRLEDEMRFLR